MPRDIKDSPQTKRIGDLLVEDGILTLDNLDEAIQVQRQTGKRIGEVLRDLEMVVESQLLDALARQLDVKKFDFGDEVIDRDVAGLVDPDLIMRHKAMPVRIDGNELWVAMEDPLNLMAIDDFRLATGYDIRPMICSHGGLERVYNELFGVSHEAQKHIEDWKREAMKDGSNIRDLLKETSSLTEIEDAPIVRFVESILEGAVDQRASDVHLEPKQDKMVVRYRVDGMLHRVMTVPRAAQAAVTARLKILAGLDTSERRRPQDGRIDLKVRDKEYDIRFSTLPTLYGEKIVMRLLDKTSIQFTLKQLGFEDEELEIWEEIIHRPHGIIYLTGPTGSGKSTTLIASLATIASEKINVVTVEDPIEYQLPTINQVQVNRKVDFSFPQALRTIVRQDPDVIMIGETRDRETAELAINAALTGHLVFSTLHTNDAAGGITRLNNMGIERFLIVASVNALVAQRLVRMLCKNCRQLYEPSKGELELIKPYLINLDGNVSNLKLYRAKGCEMCHNHGYLGRTAICEIMTMTRDIRDLIMDDASVHEIKRLARKEGMTTLFEAGLKKVLKGTVSMEELFRVAHPEEDESSEAMTEREKPLLDEIPPEILGVI